MPTHAIPLLLLAACAGSPAPEPTSTTPPAVELSDPKVQATATFFVCEKAAREAAAASEGADRAKALELATTAVQACEGVHDPNLAWARKMQEKAR